MPSKPPFAKVYPSPRSKDLPRSRWTWRVQYDNPETGKRNSKSPFKTKAAAQEWADEFKNRVKGGTWIDPDKGRVPFAEVATVWLSTRNDQRYNTANGYRRIVEGDNDLTQTFNAVPIADITYSMVLRYISSSSARLAAQTVRHRFYVLRMVLDFAVREDMLMVNPARKVEPKVLPSPREMFQQEEQRYQISVPETDRIIAAMPEPYDLLLRLLAYTGTRPEEAYALRLCDVHPDAEWVWVRSVIVETRDGLKREHELKTKWSRRKVRLDRRTRAALLDYIKTHRRRAALWFAEHPEHEHPGEELPLFVGAAAGGAQKRPLLDRLDYSKPIRHSALHKRHWNRAVKAAGLPPMRPYVLRHAAISRDVNRLGTPGALTLKEIQERYGHSSATMPLDRYGHVPTLDADRYDNALDAAIAVAADNVTDLSTKRATS